MTLAVHPRSADTMRPPVRSSRPPAWLFLATGGLAVTVLVLAVAETNLWLHYLIDGGEFISLIGLLFIGGASMALYRQRRLVASLPLTFPWLLFPVITQGDQIIDNLSINPMRAICHVLLAAIFGTPVAVVVLGARYGLPGRVHPRSPLLGVFPGVRALALGDVRQGTTLLATALLVLEMWVAVQFLGALMVATLIVMILGVLWYGSIPDASNAAEASARRARTERFALVLVLAGVAVSFGLYEGYKNRPGAYQGSPSFFMDPQQQGTGFRVDRRPVPSGTLAVPTVAPVAAAFSAYGRTLQRLLEGYHILDRNYTYDFHNELFLRSTPLVPNYRAVGLQKIAEARALRADADRQAAAARGALADDNPLAALLDDVRDYAAFNFDRSVRLETMSAGFARTKAGLQHAAHLYEGEGKFLGVGLDAILRKHQRTLEAPAAADVTGTFARDARAIYQAYASHVVGF